MKSLFDPSACGLAPAPSALADRLELFFGDANPAEARVYARLQLNDHEQRQATKLKLSGRLVGPECQFAQTLSSRLPMIDRSTSAALLAEAIVPDPCFWTPGLPFLYRAELELRRDDESSAKFARHIGIRRLGVRGRWLHFEGNRFVLRGVQLPSSNKDVESSAPNTDLPPHVETSADFLRQTWTAIIIPSPDDNLCQFASSRGILLAADLSTSGLESKPEAIVVQLHRLAQWPAVGFAVLPIDAKLPADMRSCAHNLLLAQWVHSTAPLEIAPWAQLVFVEAGDPTEFARKTAGCTVPVVAIRRLPQQAKIEPARAACDALQRDLAPLGDFAGYIV